MEIYRFWRKELNDNIKPSITGEINGLYWVWNIDSYFLYLLSLRAILWGLDSWKELILPEPNFHVSSQLNKIKNDLLNIFDLSSSQVKVWDFTKLSLSRNREPYMRTPYYYISFTW